VDENKNEISYRKGYLHGYTRAVIDLQDLIRSGITPDQILLRLHDHQVELTRWRRSDSSRLIYPPELSR